MRQLIFGMAILGLSASAPAQEVKQTPAGAAQFLATLIEQYDIRAATTYSVPGAHFTYKLTSVRAETECRMVFDAAIAGYFRKIGTPELKHMASDSPDWDEAEFQRLRSAAGSPTPPFTIDWSRVTVVVIVTTTAPDKNLPSDNLERRVAIAEGGSLPIVLMLPDEALAKRVHYAAEFLKAHCDKTAETGF